MVRTKRKRKSAAQDATSAFWACILHRVGEGRDTEKGLDGFVLPEKFPSTAEYFHSLSRLVLEEASAVTRQMWWRRAWRPGTASLGKVSMVAVPRLARHRGVDAQMWSVRVRASQVPRDWPSLRTAWLVELTPTEGGQPAPFFVARAAEQDWTLQLVGFPLTAWGWDPSRVVHGGDDGGYSLDTIGKLRPLEDLVTILRMWTACCLAPTPRFMRRVLGLPEPTHRVFSDSDEDGSQPAAWVDTRVSAEVSASPAQDPVGVGQTLGALNAMQRTAVSRVLATDNFTHSCHLLQGPPGTGKTRTIVTLLQLLAHRPLRKDGSGKVLVCAPSNGAVQVALENFLRTEESSGMALCLVGVDDRVPEEGPLRAVFLHTRAQHTLHVVQRAVGDAAALPMAVEALQALQRCAPRVCRQLGLPKGRKLTCNELKRHLAETESKRGSEASRGGNADESSSGEIIQNCGGLTARLAELARRERCGEAPELESEQLESAHVVFCTLNCAGRPGVQRALRESVDIVLVDEAAQAIEAETLIPLCLGPRQLVLIGDPMQLSATVCQSAEAKKALFCRSMMERMMSIGHDFVMLQEQYRMHPEISRFPSSRFYNGRLIDVRKPQAGSGTEGMPTLPSYAVIDVADGEEVVSHGQSSHISNPREARVLTKAAAHLCDLVSGKVVVITFYSGQVALIRQLLQKYPHKVEVHTVDSFQGSEADIVLLSFVRANKGRRLGFLSEFRRLNVALTRAKRTLLVFANAGCLATPGVDACDDVAALFSDAAARGCIWPSVKAMLQALPAALVQARRHLAPTEAGVPANFASQPSSPDLTPSRIRAPRRRPLVGRRHDGGKAVLRRAQLAKMRRHAPPPSGEAAKRPRAPSRLGAVVPRRLRPFREIGPWGCQRPKDID